MSSSPIYKQCVVIIDKPDSSILKLKNRCLWVLQSCQNQLFSGKIWGCPEAISYIPWSENVYLRWWAYEGKLIP